MKKALHFILFLSLISTLNAQTSNLWTPQAIGLIPANHDILSISVVNKDVVWAVADSTYTAPFPITHVPKILKTTNDGTTWRVYKMTLATGRAGLEIHAIDSMEAFVTGNSYNNRLPNELFKTSDGGTTWTSKATGYEASLFVRFFDAQNGIIWNRHRIARTSNGGETWTGDNVIGFLSGEGFTSASINNACAVIGDSIWSGTTISRIAFSPNRGMSWLFQDLRNVVNNFSNVVIIVSVAFKNARNGIVMG